MTGENDLRRLARSVSRRRQKTSYAGEGTGTVEDDRKIGNKIGNDQVF